MTAIGSLPRHQEQGEARGRGARLLLCPGDELLQAVLGILLCSFLGAVVETIFMFLTRGEIQDRKQRHLRALLLVWGDGRGAVHPLLPPPGRAAGPAHLHRRGRCWGGPTNTCAPGGRRSSSAPASGTTATSPSTSTAGCACSTPCSGAWPRWCGSRTSIPGCCALIGRIPRRAGVPLTWMLTLFMLFEHPDLRRGPVPVGARQMGAPPANAEEEALDRPFPR